MAVYWRSARPGSTVDQIERELVGLTDAEWLLLGVGLGGLSVTVSALVWRVFGRGPRDRN
jgi:hypothetical protein